MGYQFNSENFEKIVYESIRQDIEKMEFLRAKGSQIVLQEKQKWLENIKRDEIYKKFERDPIRAAYYNFGEFIYKWFFNIRKSVRISSTNKELTCENVKIFYDILDEIFELVDFYDLSMEIIDQIIEQNRKEEI